MLDGLALDRFGQDATHDEGTERSGEAYGRGKHHHAEAEGKGRDEHRLFVHQWLYLLQEEGDEVDAHHKPENQEGP